MTSFAGAATLAALLAAGLATASPRPKASTVDAAVREGQATVTELGPDAKAVTYWVIASDGWQVVTTVDTVINRGSDAERHAVVRFSTVLLPSQSHLISVPALGEPQQMLRVRRVGDRIEVARIPSST